MTREQQKQKFLDQAEALVAELEDHLLEIEQMTQERREANDDHPE